ncbi:hypothetical protein CYY_006583 [Polysphondylium violaceum]|uniref:SCP2 domain-containing protein n=1 Tax=Polysphondylium violaceum TaxID=133409 RepID=A0A8J4PT88_9MYCE|nr:hypothetical protein CYY_006583 [Polysphondylium violaceum]
MSVKFFEDLKATIAKDSSLLKKINGIYQFNIKNGDATKEYIVDLKNAPGSVKEGKHEKPDCTIGVGEADFVEILAGKLTEQTAFMKKKLTLKGNMALGMKFRNLVNAVKANSSAAPAAPAAAAPAASGSLDDGTKIGKVFDTLATVIKGKPELVKSIKGIYLFDIETASGKKQYTADLKNGAGSVSASAVGKPDCTITMKEADFLDLMSGKLNGQVAFGQGKLKIKGNMGLAMKLGQITKATPKAKL